MTKITRVTVRETETVHRGQKLAIQLLPKAMRLWPKGAKTSVIVPYDAIYDLGLKIAARRTP